MTMGELAGQSALITGGATGIGLESARPLARAGASVTISDADAGRRAVTEVDGDVRFIRTDMTDLGEVDHLARNVNVDILVNAASTSHAAMTADEDVERFELTFAANVTGTYFLVADIVPTMIRRGGGAIVTITSTAARGAAGASTYAASSAALQSLSRSWAHEFGAHGIRVNSVAATAPEAIAGDRAWWQTSSGDGISQVVLDQAATPIALRRRAHPREIAEAVYFLASPKASFITGSTLHVDGGSLR
jgi:NAD(P)-dependent dehydrogenase (short-subunit alcohol dehydrogenase family)